MTRSDNWILVTIIFQARKLDEDAEHGSGSRMANYNILQLNGTYSKS